MSIIKITEWIKIDKFNEFWSIVYYYLVTLLALSHSMFLIYGKPHLKITVDTPFSES